MYRVGNNHERNKDDQGDKSACRSWAQVEAVVVAYNISPFPYRSQDQNQYIAIC
jgi:hypothetical protein